MNRNIISISDFTCKRIDYVIDESLKLKKEGETESLGGKTVAELFFEPSTQIHQSFFTAAKRLGADIFGFSEKNQQAQKRRGIPMPLLQSQIWQR